jgi:type II secretory pathway pseudopilin PulG
LIELLVVMALVAILVAFLMPSLKETRRLGKITACKSNMRGTLVACLTYAGEYRQELPWNYTDDEARFGAHDHLNPNDAWESYTKWYVTLDTLGTNDRRNSNHLFSEGLSQRSFWRGKLLAGKYGDSRMMGCVIPPDKTWNPTSTDNDVERYHGDSPSSVREAPPFIYRGRAVGGSHAVNVYTGGNIAFRVEAGEWHGTFNNRTAHTPDPHLGGNKIIFTCPVYKKDLHAYESAFYQPHQRSSRTLLYWSELSGFGGTGHVVAQNIGWYDGSVKFADSKEKKFHYVHPETGVVFYTGNNVGVY